MFAAVLITFLLVHATEGSPGAVRLGPGATAEEIAAENAELGWDRPLYVQFFDYLGSLVQGDLGTSLIDGRDIASDLADRLPVTASIAVFATLLSGIVGVFARRHRRGARRPVRQVPHHRAAASRSPCRRSGSVSCSSTCSRSSSNCCPATGYVSFTTNPAAWLDSILLPVLTLTVGGAAIIARTASVGMREALRQEHIRTLRATGTPEWRIRYVHALRFASVPVVSVLGIQFIALFGGSVIIENLFALPGLGQASQVAALSSDFPALIGVVVVATVVVVIINLLLDLVIACARPEGAYRMSVLPLDAADEVATEPVPPAQASRPAAASCARPGGIFGAAWLTFMIIASLTAPLWRALRRRRAGHRQPAGAAVGRALARHRPAGPRPAQPDLHRRHPAAAGLGADADRRLRHRPAAGADRGRTRPPDRAGDQPADRGRDGAAAERSCCWP